MKPMIGVAMASALCVMFTATGVLAATYTVGGTVSGLAGGESVVVQNYGTDDITVTTDGPFTFGALYSDGVAYLVTVMTVPTGKDCRVENGSGTVSGANIINVAVTCSATPPGMYSVGGTVSGLELSNYIILQNNGADDQTLRADGAFTFATKLADKAAYSVTVKTTPMGENCQVKNRSGAINGANVTNVAITCSFYPQYISISGRITWKGAGLVSATVSDGTRSTFTDANGEYSIDDVPNGTYKVTPSIYNFTFTPASRSVTVNDESVSDVNFTATYSSGHGGDGSGGGCSCSTVDMGN